MRMLYRCVGGMAICLLAACGEPATAAGTKVVEWRRTAQLNDTRFTLGEDVGPARTVTSDVLWSLSDGRGRVTLGFEVDVGEMAVQNPTPVIPARVRGPRRIVVTVKD